MNTLNDMLSSSIYKTGFLIIGCMLGMLFLIPLVQASETVIPLSPQSQDQLNKTYSTEQLLYNTPRLGASQTHWDDFVASINWADYDNLSHPIIRTTLTSEQLLHSTPRLGASRTDWDDFVASINWADYTIAHSSSLSTNCRVAC